MKNAVENRGFSDSVTTRWLTDEIQRRYFDWLDSPIQRISGAESAPTISAVLEKAALPNEDTVAQALVDYFATPHGSR